MLPALATPRRKLWTRDEVDRINRTGVLAGERFELIEGELINKMGEGSPHAISVKFIYGWMISAFGFDYINQCTPIDVSPEDNPTSQPEPDICVLRSPFWKYREPIARPADIVMVIEVSATSLYTDLKNKAGLYARAGIPEYWILDVERRRLIVHREPEDGKYRSVRVYSESESIAPLAAPDRDFAVADAFPR